MTQLQDNKTHKKYIYIYHTILVIIVSLFFRDWVAESTDALFAQTAGRWPWTIKLYHIFSLLTGFMSTVREDKSRFVCCRIFIKKEEKEKKNKLECWLSGFCELVITCKMRWHRHPVSLSTIWNWMVPSLRWKFSFSPTALSTHSHPRNKTALSYAHLRGLSQLFLTQTAWKLNEPPSQL